MYSKYHGCGNDFILGIFNEDVNYSEFAIKYCNRYTGIGADGLILVKFREDENIKYEMVFYNADGTRAPMCGNGIRCFCKYLYDEKIELGSKFDVYTLGGIMSVGVESFDPYMVTINFGKPDFSTLKLDIDYFDDKFVNQIVNVNSKEFVVDCVYIGTHHLVTVVDSIDSISEQDGYELCNYEKFLKKMNVNFVEIVDKENIKVKTYERGVGFTKACGTGGGACFVVLNNKGLVANKITNHIEYGILK